MVMGIPKGDPEIYTVRTSMPDSYQVGMNRSTATILIEELALGTRLDPKGLNHDNDSLMDLAADLAREGHTMYAERIKRHALKVNSLHLSIVKDGLF